MDDESMTRRKLLLAPCHVIGIWPCTSFSAYGWRAMASWSAAHTSARVLRHGVCGAAFGAPPRIPPLYAHKLPRGSRVHIAARRCLALTAEQRRIRPFRTRWPMFGATRGMADFEPGRFEEFNREKGCTGITVCSRCDGITALHSAGLMQLLGLLIHVPVSAMQGLRRGAGCRDIRSKLQELPVHSASLHSTALHAVVTRHILRCGRRQEFFETEWLKSAVYSPNVVFVVAEDSATGKVVGTSSVLLDYSAQSDLCGEFGRLAVHPDARGRGIGNLLMQERLALANRSLHVAVVENRCVHPRSQAVSAKHGFVCCGFLPQVGAY